MTDRLLAVGRAVCERRGYEVTAPGRPWLPPRLAEPTADAAPFVPEATASSVAIEPLGPREITPTTLVSRLRNNRGTDRFSLFVVDDESAARDARAVLCGPPLVAAENAHGRRAFYNGPDRVPLAGGGFAAVRTDSAAEELVWRETGDGDVDDRSLLLVDRGSGTDGAADGNRARDGSVLAHLDGVDDLACPDTAAFPYSYARDPEDKRFRVRRGDRAVGVYDGPAAMRANAYVPVPMPLVPEHVFAGVPSVRDEWAVVATSQEVRASEGAADTDLSEGTALATADGVAALDGR